MRQFWVGLIVVIVALALGVGGAYGASLLVRNHLANLPATATRLNRNTPSGQPGNNSRRFNNPLMNPGGRGPMMGPGMRGFGNFFNCPTPNPGQNPGSGQGQSQNNCRPFNRFNQPNQPTVPTPTPSTPNNGSGNGPF
jgi:hypothetical protein